MIRVSCESTALTLRGHAGAAAYGQDLVCAGVSALVYALAQRLSELEDRGALETPLALKLEPGDARISAVPKGEYAGEVRACFQLVESGLRLLEKHYPGQVKVGGEQGIEDTRYEIQDTRYKIQDTRYKIQDTRYKIQDISPLIAR